MQLTKYNKYTNDDVYTDACVVHMIRLSSHIARTLAHLFMSSHTSLAQDLSLDINISIVIHERTSLSRFSLFYFHLSFPVFFFSFHLLHCELYSELDNLIVMESLCYSANKGSDDAPRRLPPPSQVMSPTSWPSASSTTHQVPSPTLSRHRTWILTTLHSASCSQRHTEDKPITANQKACQSVSQSSSVCVRWIRET